MTVNIYQGATVQGGCIFFLRLDFCFTNAHYLATPSHITHTPQHFPPTIAKARPLTETFSGPFDIFAVHANTFQAWENSYCTHILRPMHTLKNKQNIHTQV